MASLLLSHSMPSVLYTLARDRAAPWDTLLSHCLACTHSAVCRSTQVYSQTPHPNGLPWWLSTPARWFVWWLQTRDQWHTKELHKVNRLCMWTAPMPSLLLLHCEDKLREENTFYCNECDEFEMSFLYDQRGQAFKQNKNALYDCNMEKNNWLCSRSKHPQSMQGVRFWLLCLSLVF